MRKLAAVALISCSLCLAQSPQFEVAVIKPNVSGGGNMFFRPTPGRFNAENMQLKELIMVAYGVKGFQIQGGPAWIESARFDITAKAENNAAMPQMLPMLQSLLEDHFKLSIRREQKDLPVYVLVPAKGGVQTTGIEGRQLRRAYSWRDAAAAT